MRHCMDFEPLDTWFLKPTKDFRMRKINIGFCPICGKPIAEIRQFATSGECYFETYSGVDADKICKKYSSEIDFKNSTLVRTKMKSQLYGWLYGVNKFNKKKGTIDQFSSDFYGNKALIKRVLDE